MDRYSSINSEIYSANGNDSGIDSETKSSLMGKSTYYEKIQGDGFISPTSSSPENHFGFRCYLQLFRFVSGPTFWLEHSLLVFYDPHKQY